MALRIRRTAPFLWVPLALPLLASEIHAQEAAAPDGKGSFTVDEALAKKGKSLWTAKGCMGCHTIGRGPVAGPDLAGVLDRRSADWVRRFVKDPNAMFDTDSTAQALLRQFNNTKMPNLKLTDAEIDALLHYIAQESQKRSKAK